MLRLKLQYWPWNRRVNSMREIKIGEQTIGLRASPLALLFYKQEFGRDLVGDLIKLGKIGEDFEDFDSVVLLQIAWALAKAEKGLNKQFPSFPVWINGLEIFDVTDMDVVQTIVDEAVDGFFRAANQPTEGSKK